MDWVQRVGELHRMAVDHYSNCGATVEDYDGNHSDYASELVARIVEENGIEDDTEENVIRARGADGDRVTGGDRARGARSHTIDEEGTRRGLQRIPRREEDAGPGLTPDPVSYSPKMQDDTVRPETKCLAVAGLHRYPAQPVVVDLLPVVHLSG